MFLSLLTEGINYLLSKKHNVQDSADIRPIVCLATLYKFRTSGRFRMALESWVLNVLRRHSFVRTKWEMAKLEQFEDF